MSRIPSPSSIETSPAASQPQWLAVQGQLGSVPNLFCIVGNSPAAHGDELGAFDTHGRGRRPDELPGLTERGR